MGVVGIWIVFKEMKLDEISKGVSQVREKRTKERAMGSWDRNRGQGRRKPVMILGSDQKGKKKPPGGNRSRRGLSTPPDASDRSGTKRTEK